MTASKGPKVSVTFLADACTWMPRLTICVVGLCAGYSDLGKHAEQQHWAQIRLPLGHIACGRRSGLITRTRVDRPMAMPAEGRSSFWLLLR